MVKKSHKKTTAKKPAKKQAQSVTAQPVSPAVAIATRTLTVVHCTDAARSAFAGQTTTDERVALGQRTRAKDTLSCVGSWISIMHAALGQRSIRYSPARLAFLCEATLTLSDAMTHDGSGRDGKKGAGSHLGALRSKAMHLRAELLSALGDVAAGDDDAEGQLAAISRDDRDDELVSALGKLATMAKGYFTRAEKDQGVAALLNGVLTEDDVTAASETAKSLSAASVGKIDAGIARDTDAPEVNLAEGLVIAEMRVARRAFERAHLTDSRVPRLVPTGPLRAVLGSHHAVAVEAPPPSPPNQGNGAAVTA